MKRLIPLLCPGPVKSKQRWEYTLRDAQTRQTLIVDSPDRDFSLYQLDCDWEGRTTRGPRGDVKEKSADGLLVVSFEDASGVCFIDLKGKMATAEQQAHGVAQMESSARHFAPLARAGEAQKPAHGDEHHDSWTAQRPDQPDEVLPGHPTDREHFVGGLFVLNRELARELPPPLLIAGKAVQLAALRIDRTDAPNVARIGARELCERAQLLVRPDPPLKQKDHSSPVRGKRSKKQSGKTG